MDYAPCPTCGQYSHSIDEGFVGEAYLHFEAMFSHRGDGFPTQHVHDQTTRDMAQRLLAEITTLRAEIASRDAALVKARADALEEAIAAVNKTKCIDASLASLRIVALCQESIHALATQDTPNAE